MKNRLKSSIGSLLSLLLFVGSAHAQLSIPSDGSAGDLNVTADTTVDLSQATTGNWDLPGSSTGVYDPQKWAVVFKYNSVTIASGKTLKFQNRPGRPPVVWLVKGNVTINGTLSLGASGQEPGPGGFRGGFDKASATSPQGAGFGPGGANSSNDGSYGTRGGAPGVIYGNAAILPLIGGSGAGGYESYGDTRVGGGAILIAASGTVAVNGSIQAIGSRVSYGGSGGQFA